MKKVILVAALVAWPAFAHEGVDHDTPDEAARHKAETASLPAPQGLPLPFNLGGPFTLTDHTGAMRTAADPDGNFQLLFFGYANCEAICSVALPIMADVTDRLRADGHNVTPVMITVDPKRDTVENIGAPLQEIHPDFVGLTGSEAELAPVYDLFAVEKSVVFEEPDGSEVFAHGSHIYLLDGDGKVLTLLPPILSVERITEITAAYSENS